MYLKYVFEIPVFQLLYNTTTNNCLKRRQWLKCYDGRFKLLYTKPNNYVDILYTSNRGLWCT